MERRILEGWKFREEIIHEQRDLAIAIGFGRPIIGRQHRRHRDGVDRLLLVRNQVWVVLGRQARGQIVALQRLLIVDANQMKAVVLELADRLVRLAADNDHGVDFAGLQFLHRDALLDIHDLWLEAEPFEHGQRGNEGAAIGKVDADGLAVELPEIVDRFRGDDVHLLIVELCDIGELFFDVFRKALLLQIIERVGPYDPEIDALQEQDIGDALHRAAADNGENAQLVAVVEHGSEVGAELNIGAADGAGYHRHGIGVQVLLGLDRPELEDRLEAFADLRRIEFRFLGANREGKRHHHGEHRHSKVSSHWYRPPDFLKANSASEPDAASHPMNRTGLPSGTNRAP